MKSIKREGFEVPIFDDEHLCPECSYPLDERGCHGCAIFHSKKNLEFTGGEYYFDRVFSVGEYHQRKKFKKGDSKYNLARLILLLKSGNESALSFSVELLKIKIEEIIPQLGISLDNSFICPIPDNEDASYKKGDELALELSKRTGISFYKFLKKIKKIPKQSKIKSIKERYDNVKGAFDINKELSFSLKGKIILLIDDVVTSIATINECSKILKDNGAEKVFVFSIGREILSLEKGGGK